MISEADYEDVPEHLLQPDEERLASPPPVPAFMLELECACERHDRECDPELADRYASEAWQGYEAYDK